MVPITRLAISLLYIFMIYDMIYDMIWYIQTTFTNKIERRRRRRQNITTTDPSIYHKVIHNITRLLIVYLLRVPVDFVQQWKCYFHVIALLRTNQCAITLFCNDTNAKSVIARSLVRNFRSLCNVFPNVRRRVLHWVEQGLRWEEEWLLQENFLLKKQKLLRESRKLRR